MHPSPNVHGNAYNMMDGLKSNMMTMMLFQNMNHTNPSEKNSFAIIYTFLVTSIIDIIFRNAPIVFQMLYRRYMYKLDSMKRELANTTMDITDNKVKKKTASITLTVNVNNPENILGQAVLDYITNNRNTTHISYIGGNFILNQKDIILIDEDVFAKMTESTDSNSSTFSNTSGSSSATSSVHIIQIIEIYSFTKTTDELRDFLDNIKQKYMIQIKNKLGNKRYFFNLHPLNVPMDMNKRKDLSRLPPNFVFTMKQFQTNRKFSNLFGSDMESIRNRVNFFCKNKKWYDEKGIPHTLGLLLSGNPGTGKTSTIKCIANETNRHICNVNLNNDISKKQLENLFFNEDISVINNSGQIETFSIPLDQRIYVLEDIDCQEDMVLERTLKQSTKEVEPANKEADPFAVNDNHAIVADTSNKIDLSFLLNLLDGVLENPGRILIMTSNHPEMLDSALIRPGRIDVIAKFRNCTNAVIMQMMEFFYDRKLTKKEQERIEQLPEEMVTPAMMSKIMFEHIHDPIQAICVLERMGEEKVFADGKANGNRGIFSESSEVQEYSDDWSSDSSASARSVEVSHGVTGSKSPDKSSSESTEQDISSNKFTKDHYKIAYMMEIQNKLLTKYKPVWEYKEWNVEYRQTLQDQLKESLRKKLFDTEQYELYVDIRYKGDISGESKRKTLPYPETERFLYDEADISSQNDKKQAHRSSLVEMIRKIESDLVLPKYLYQASNLPSMELGTASKLSFSEF